MFIHIKSTSVVEPADMQVQIKNTFIEFVESDAPAPRRSSSAPPGWALRAAQGEEDTLSKGNARTSEGELSTAISESSSTCGDSDEAYVPSSPLKWSDMLDLPDECSVGAADVDPTELAECRPCRRLNSKADAYKPALNSRANAFTPASVRLEEIRQMVTETQRALARDTQVCGCTLVEAHMGGATKIIAEVDATTPGVSPQKTLSVAKTALLEAAARSRSSYILGYNSKPFTGLGLLAFSAWIAYVPPHHENDACWDMCTHGACPRPAACRWWHPSPAELMQVVVALQVRQPAPRAVGPAAAPEDQARQAKSDT